MFFVISLAKFRIWVVKLTKIRIFPYLVSREKTPFKSSLPADLLI